VHIVPATNLACPIDGLPIETRGAQRRCAAGHSFDMAREGYCNFLVVQHKASRDPGDSKHMVAARRRILDAGHFESIANLVFDAVRNCAKSVEDSAFNIIDAGCGEGYYLDYLGRLAAESPQTGTLGLAGIDISKWAVKAAARRKVSATWLVANNRIPPFLDGSVDLVLCLFGFPIWEGFKKIQKPGGHVLLVDPAADHLLELREIIYPTVKRSKPPMFSSPVSIRLSAGTPAALRPGAAARIPISMMFCRVTFGRRTSSIGYGRRKCSPGGSCRSGFPKYKTTPSSSASTRKVNA
jgi:23S rRNA (guanine745-N1)-methyltransferase